MKGRGQEAVRLLSAMVGTINSVCGRIVSEFAIDLGRSPTNQVIPAEERDELLRLAADPVFARHAPKILGTVGGARTWRAQGERATGASTWPASSRRRTRTASPQPT